jgi:acyl-CoA hydrolase
MKEKEPEHLHDGIHDKHMSMTVLMTPDMVNFSGKVHGGHILKILDQVAYATATRYCGHYAVTLSVDQVFFREPVHVGELVTFLSSVNYTGRTSMEIGIKVIAENARSRTKRHALSCFFTMVAVDEKSKPTDVPQLKLQSTTEKRRWKEALSRRSARQELQSTHSKNHKNINKKKSAA